MIVHHALCKKCSICSHHASKRSKLFSNLGIALMRHGDTANPARPAGFAKFANLVALQIIDFMADPIGSTRCEHKQLRPFSQDVAACCPRHDRLAKAETGKKVFLHRQCLRSHGGKTADTAAKLADIKPLSGLIETLPVAPQLGEPAGGFEAKGDRQ